MMPQAAPVAAASILPCSSVPSVRAVRAIQKTIQVTMPTATIESDPPIASCASNVRPRGPKVRSAPNAMEMETAAPIPIQSFGRRWERPLLTR